MSVGLVLGFLRDKKDSAVELPTCAGVESGGAD